MTKLTKPIGFYTRKKKVRPVHAGMQLSKVQAVNQMQPLVTGKHGYSVQRERFLHERKGGWDLDKARALHRSRTERAQVIDESLEATKKLEPSEEWASKMNRTDILGVDYIPVPLSTKLEDNYKVNVQIWTREYEDHFNVDLGDLKFRRTTSKGYRALAYYKPSKHTIYFSQKVHKILSSGKVEDARDVFLLQSLAHEIGHAVKGGGRVGYKNTKPFLEEGSNEISALRFALHNIQLPRSIRLDVLKEPSKILGYGSYCDAVADMSLAMNEGDERRAIEWIDKLRTEPDHSKFVKKSVPQRFKNYLWLKGYSEGGTVSEMDLDQVSRSVSRDLPSYLKEQGIKPTKERFGYGKNHRYWYLMV